MKCYLNNNFRRIFEPRELPACVLTSDTWDDYGTKCKFHLTYHSEDGNTHEIGAVKILQKGVLTTIIRESFDDLDDNYISLGQTLEYYENLLRVCGYEDAVIVLTALRDIAWRPQLAEPFEPTGAFRNAILRANTAYKARRFGQAIIESREFDESFSFHYVTDIPGADEPVDTYIDFDDNDLVPGRIVGIIGRNAVGKTQYLAKLAGDLVQIKRTSREKTIEREVKFRGQRPIFNRVITISYSAFDKFSRPVSKQVSYVYCGIRNEKGGLSRQHLVETYKNNLFRVREYGREREWIQSMQDILGDQSEALRHHLSTEIETDQVDDLGLSLLSSGQSILAHFVTSLLAWVEPTSIILFDEPETHLHPNAVASMFNILNKILEDHESFAIIATHSPVVIQEIPAKRVLMFTREGNVTIADSLTIETLGENISELTRHVFETIEIPNHYKQVLRRLSRRRSFEDVMELFEGKLSINAQSYLLSFYGDD